MLPTIFPWNSNLTILSLLTRQKLMHQVNIGFFWEQPHTLIAYTMRTPWDFSISFYNDVFSRLQSKEGISIINIMQGKEPLQKLNSQMCGPFCIYIAHYLYNKLFFEIPQVNEVNLLNFLRHMFS